MEQTLTKEQLQVIKQILTNAFDDSVRERRRALNDGSRESAENMRYCQGYFDGMKDMYLAMYKNILNFDQAKALYETNVFDVE